MRKRRRYTEEEKDFLMKNVPGKSSAETVALFNARFDKPITERKLLKVKHYYGLKSGIPNRYQKGHVPKYKGMTGCYKQKPTSKSTNRYFKKGHEAYNRMAIGSVTKRYGHLFVKVAEPNKWRYLHHAVWEKVNGPIPKGHVIIFVDGNKHNSSIDNLMLVTKAQHLMLNKHKLRGESRESIKTGLLAAKVVCKAWSRRIRLKQGDDGK